MQSHSAIKSRRTGFFREVEPLLQAKCVSCHGEDAQEGNLRLDSLAAALKGGDSGPALVLGDIEQSLLVKAIQFDDGDLQMPPKDPLPAAEKELFTSWVKQGAHWPAPVLVLFDEEQEFRPR
ncbi:MAG: c-type cytochrome domain-containing protein [Planctomycetaceae bacterium]